MTLTFFYNVTDTGKLYVTVFHAINFLSLGSWLEIGQTISFFCITSLLLVWSAGICVSGEWLMLGTLRHEKQKFVKIE